MRRMLQAWRRRRARECGITIPLQDLGVVKAILLELLKLCWQGTPLTAGVCPDLYNNTSLVVSCDE